VEGLLIPLFPLEVVLFPGQPLPLHIFEDRYKEMIGECLETGCEFGVVLAKENSIVNVGCTAAITNVAKRYDDGRMDIETAGRRRFEVLFLNESKSYLRAAAQFFLDDAAEPEAKVRTRALELHAEVLALLFPDPDDRAKYVLDPGCPQRSFVLMGPLPVDLDFKQALLALRSEPERLEQAVNYLGKLAARLRLVTRVRGKAGSNGQGR
jgi:Lon protease-like protein